MGNGQAWSAGEGWENGHSHAAADRKTWDNLSEAVIYILSL